jgi:hypothetical protein
MNIDTFINGLIFGNMLAMGYKIESLRLFFPDYTDSQIAIHFSGMFMVFFVGGLIALLFNLFCHTYPGKKKAHAARISVLLIAVAAWLSGIGTIGYHNENDFELNVVIHFVLISFFGGYFFWGALGMQLVQMRTSFDLGIMINVVSPAVFGLVMNVYYVSTLQAQGGYLYSYRIVLLTGAVLFLIRLLMIMTTFSFKEENDVPQTVERSYLLPNLKPQQSIFQKNKPVQPKTPVPDSSRLAVLHYVNVFVQSIYIHLPFVCIPLVPNIPITSTLNGLFGGMIVSMFVGGLMISFARSRMAFDVLSWLAQIAWIVLFITWPHILSDPVGFGWGFGIAFGFTWTGHVYGVLSLADIKVAVWMCWCVVAVILGMGISMLLAIFVDWSRDAVGWIAVVPGISMVLGGVEIYLKKNKMT